MANLTRVRLCAFGTEDHMRMLCVKLLLNCRWLESTAEELKNKTLEQLQALIVEQARLEGGEESTFSYGMVTERPYGDALEHTCRLTIERHPSGLWLAGFCYDSETSFQPEDWQRLHVQCAGMPIAVLFANEDFNLQKGMKLIVGGRVGDNWDYMGEVWLWLMAQYMADETLDDAVARLRKLRRHIDEDDFDMTIGELLNSCIGVLEGLRDEMADPEALLEEARQYRADSDYESLFMLQSRIAETYLWDVANADKWITALETVQEAWVAAEGEDA